MDEKRLKAYLELIQELLNCPDEEEQILDDKSDLIDAGLMQIILVTAADFTGKNQLEEAYRLIIIVKRQLESIGLEKEELVEVLPDSEAQVTDQDEDKPLVLSTYFHKGSTNQEEKPGLIDAILGIVGLGIRDKYTEVTTRYNIHIAPDSSKFSISGDIFEAMGMGHSPTGTGQLTDPGSSTIPNGTPSNPNNPKTDDFPKPANP